MKINEAYTSTTCLRYGHLNKVAGRTYRCRACDHRAHCDGVGAVNILNQGMHGKIRPGECVNPHESRITLSRRGPAEPGELLVG
ncbi:MAG: zinc ribbon domain-containing protein [Firmicutes bacterium]|nr:zinc ribbon domain-containing protein [Bacillota bacterium]